MDERDDRAHARPPRSEDLARIGRALNEAGARYLLIGGFAIMAHGAGRTTRDIDLLVEDSEQNIRLVKMALGVLEDNAVSEVPSDKADRQFLQRLMDEENRSG